MLALKFVARALAQRLARRYKVDKVLYIIPLIPFVIVVLTIAVAMMFAAVRAGALNSNDCGSNSPPVGAAGNTATEGAIVRYFESQGISPNGAAGITGNLEQENRFSPVTNGGGIGIAQWDPGRGAAMQAWDRQHNLDPNTLGGQLTYLVYDLRTNYPQLLAQLNQASDPATATVAFQTTYEQCGTCVTSQRIAYADSALKAAGGGNTVPVSFTPGGSCIAVGGSGGDPIPGFTPSRDDMGVDACGKPGAPILAPAQSTLVDVVPGWYNGQPLLLFQFNPPLSGTYHGDQYWYVAEQIVPASVTRGTVFGPGQPVATYAPSGTCIELGWGSPTTNSRTLVPTDANPPRGALTPEAESFKVYFHIPWVGVSP